MMPGTKATLGIVIGKVLKVDINKRIEFDWKKKELTERDIEYAGNDVLYLHPLLSKLLEQHPSVHHLYTYHKAMKCTFSIAMINVEGYDDLLSYEQDGYEIRTQKRDWWHAQSKDYTTQDSEES